MFNLVCAKQTDGSGHVEVRKYHSICQWSWQGCWYHPRREDKGSSMLEVVDMLKSSRPEVFLLIAGIDSAPENLSNEHKKFRNGQYLRKWQPFKWCHPCNYELQIRQNWASRELLVFPEKMTYIEQIQLPPSFPYDGNSRIFAPCFLQFEKSIISWIFSLNHV